MSTKDLKYFEQDLYKHLHSKYGVPVIRNAVDSTIDQEQTELQLTVVSSTKFTEILQKITGSTPVGTDLSTRQSLEDEIKDFVNNHPTVQWKHNGTDSSHFQQSKPTIGPNKTQYTIEVKP